jgi:hypothetical protein
MTTSAESLKFDHGKTRWDLLPAGAVCFLRTISDDKQSGESCFWRFARRVRGSDDAYVLTQALFALARKLDQTPRQLLDGIAQVMTYGAAKYGDNNWRSNGGLAYSRLIAAAGRHRAAMPGVDDETGLLHAYHYGCCLLFLLEYVLTGNGKDDRWSDAQNTKT